MLSNKRQRRTLSAAFILAAATLVPTSQLNADTGWHDMTDAPPVTTQQLDTSKKFDDTPHFRNGLEFAQTQSISTVELPDGAGVIELPDLSSHPLAGTEVEILIEVEDALGQASRTQAVTITLPKPVLRNPINEALADIRRDLALNPENAQQLSLDMQELLDNLPEDALSQEALEQLQNIQNELSDAAQSLEDAQQQNEQGEPNAQNNPSDPAQQSSEATPSETSEASEAEAKEQLDDVIDDLWEAMQDLEQEAISEAEKAFNEAQEALAEALENGASPEQLQELTQQAQEAMEALLQEQAEQAAESQDPELQGALEQLQEMMQEMQEMMEQLSPDQQQMAAQMQQQMMQQMQQQMQQSQSQQSQSQQSQSQQSQLEQLQQQMQQMQQQMQQMQQMQEAQDELQEIIEEQQEVMEDTIANAQQHAEELPALVEALWETVEYIEQRSAELKAIDDEFIRLERERIQEELNLYEYELMNLDEDLPLDELQGMYDKREKELSEDLRDHLRSYTNRVDSLMSDIQRQRGYMKGYENNGGGQMMLNQIRSSRNILNTYLGRLMALEIEEPDVPNVENQTFTQPRAANDSATQKVRDELELVQEELERLVNDTDQIETRQQTLETDLQRVVRQIEQLGMDPGELGNAVDAMDNAESELSSNSPATAIPEQARAMQALREGQEQLQEQMQQQQQQQQQSSGGSQPSQSGSDGQGSPQFSTGIVDGDGQVTPNISNPNIELGIDPEANPNLSRDIRDQIRQRLTEEGMTPLERQYLEGLLTERPSQGSSVIPSVRPPRP